MTCGQLGNYQAILLDNPNAILKAVSTLNPATLFSSEQGEQNHDCIQIIAQVYFSRLDLTDLPRKILSLKMLTDGSSFMDTGNQKAEYTTETLHVTLEAEALQQVPQPRRPN